MIINKINKLLLTAVTILITPFKWVMIAPTYFLMNMPLIKIVYQILVMVVWFPFGVFISVMSVIYQAVPVIGFLLALAGIPVVVAGYALSYLLSPQIKEERAFIAASQSYPTIGDVI
jgi:hypothetical protein